MSDPPRQEFRWTRGRVLLAAALALHWLCVMIWALPDGGWRVPLISQTAPLPSWNTHEGEARIGGKRQSIIQTYLIATQQTQRWKMFTPRRPNVTFLTLEYERPGGPGRVHRLAGPDGLATYFTPRWRFLEWALMNPDRRDTWVPAAQPALARRLGEHDASSVKVTKWAYPVPLLADDGTGNPLFTDAGAWRQRTDAAEGFVPIELGTFPLGEDAP